MSCKNKDTWGIVKGSNFKEITYKVKKRTDEKNLSLCIEIFNKFLEVFGLLIRSICPNEHQIFSARMAQNGLE